MTTKEVIEHFYNGLNKKDNSWQENLADTVVFSDASNMLHQEGKEGFVQAFTQFLRGVESIEIKQLIIDGENACAVVSYNYVSPSGNKMQQDDAEVWRIENGRIASLTIYFDITEFRNFMKS